MNNFYENVLKKINSGIIILDEKLSIIYWNEWLEQYTGIFKNQILGKNVQDLIPVFKENYYIQLFQKALTIGQSMFCSGGLHPVFIYPANIKEGGIVKQNLQIDVVSIEGKNCIFLQIIDTTNQFKRVETLKYEIANRKQMEQLLFNEKEKFRTTLLSVGDGVISTDQQGQVLILNQVAERLTGWAQEEAAGKPLETVFKIISGATREKCESPVELAFSSGQVSDMTNQAIHISKHDTEIHIEYNAAPIRDEQGKIDGMVLVFRDVTEKKQRQDEIKYLSFHDQLTGLYNRRFYEEELVRLDVERNWPLTIILGDINGLKMINDSFGHATGDELIIKAGVAIKKGCRADDIISRIGGDEFVILLPQTNAFEAEKIITRIQEFLAIEKVGALSLSVSFGYETKINEDVKIKDVFKKAEDLMYHNKLFDNSWKRGKAVDTIINTLYQKIEREEQHSHGVSQLSQSLGEVLGLSQHQIKELKTAGLFHDIGKIAIDEAILNKPGKLTDDEWKEIKRHSEIGFRVLSTVNEMSEMAVFILSHHEWWNGTGYPKGIKGLEIPLESRIIGITDAYDAMTGERCYAPALSREEAIDELRKNSGIQFDPSLVEFFIKAVLRMDAVD